MFFWKRFKTSHYPRAIIPCRSYVHKMDVHRILEENPGFFVARRLDGTLIESTEVRNGCRFFRLDSLGELKHLSKMSLDLLGGRYLPEKHQRFRTRGEGSSSWDGKTVFCRIPKSCFTYWEQECCSVAINASSLKSVTIPYRKQLNQEQLEELVNRGISIEKFTRKQEYELEGELRLEHEPSNLNYWHFQANFYPAGETEPMEGEKKGWKGNALNYIVQFLLATPVYSFPDYMPPVISKKYYLM